MKRKRNSWLDEPELMEIELRKSQKNFSSNVEDFFGDGEASFDNISEITDEDLLGVEDIPDEYKSQLCDDMSIFAALERETMSLAKYADIDEGFFKRGTMDERFEIYNELLSFPEVTPSSALYQFAKQAQIYDLFRYAWGVIRSRFPEDMLRGKKADIEMCFSESILKSMEIYDPAIGSAKIYFGRRIFGDVYNELNKNSLTPNKLDSYHDIKALGHMQIIKTSLEDAGFKSISEGDYILEMHNNFSSNDHLTRSRLSYLVSKIDGENNISSDALEGFDETFVSDTVSSERVQDPQTTVIRNQVRSEIVKVILKNAETEADGLAFIRYYYHSNDEGSISLEAIRETYYNNEASISHILNTFDKLSAKLRNDKSFLLLLGKSDHDDDYNHTFVSSADDLSSYSFDLGEI